MSERVVAELYRILRVAWSVAFTPQGRVTIDDGIIWFNGTVHKLALQLAITPIGLQLLESATASSGLVAPALPGSLCRGNAVAIFLRYQRRTETLLR